MIISQATTVSFRSVLFDQVNHPWPFCCLAPVRRDGTLLRLSKQATLQFVVVKPTMAILSLIALAAGQYFADSFQVCMLYVRVWLVG